MLIGCIADHFIDDVQSYYSCCKWSNNCDKYSEKRPTQDCSDYVPPATGKLKALEMYKTYLRFSEIKIQQKKLPNLPYFLSSLPKLHNFPNPVKTWEALFTF